jgi:hypothetical protein
MVTRIWHGVTPASKSDEYLNLMRTVAIPITARPPATRALTRYDVWKAIRHIS